MSIKLIAIGNRLMCDEGIAVQIAEKLKDEFLNQDVDVIIKETASDISSVITDPSDFYFILDATCYNLTPGTITIVPLRKNTSFFNNYITNHEINLIGIDFKYRNKISGYIIGIEVEQITFNNRLSIELEKELATISEKVKSLICVLSHYRNNTDIYLNIVQNKINCLS